MVRDFDLLKYTLLHLREQGRYPGIHWEAFLFEFLIFLTCVKTFYSQAPHLNPFSGLAMSHVSLPLHPYLLNIYSAYMRQDLPPHPFF